MGNRALLDALELMAAERRGAGLDQVPSSTRSSSPRPTRTPACSLPCCRAIRPLAERLTLYGSDRDLALEISEKVHGDLRAGGAGGRPASSSRRRLDSIDMSVLGDDILAHSYFAKSSSALIDMLDPVLAQRAAGLAVRHGRARRIGRSRLGFRSRQMRRPRRGCRR